MKTNTRQALHWSTAAIAIGLVLPSYIILCLEVFIGRISPLASIAGILERQFAHGHNLFLIAAFGLIPFAVLSVACFVAARWLNASRLACVAVGGLLGILVLMIPAHVSVWYPLYGPGRMSSTAVIAFLFIPFYCIATLCIGLVVGWFVSLLPSFRHQTSFTSSEAN
ncbi:MAG TPA: hypothetical protein VFG14_06250 [Chthoniobacteraceae bacterium]|nr:hypothetical protein [Chthoniobacteraceae bacterium]